MPGENRNILDEVHHLAKSPGGLRPALMPGEDRNLGPNATRADAARLRPALMPGEDRNAGYIRDGNRP